VSLSCNDAPGRGFAPANCRVGVGCDRELEWEQSDDAAPSILAAQRE
jgi:hypothetical protein